MSGNLPDDIGHMVEQPVIPSFSTVHFHKPMLVIHASPAAGGKLRRLWFLVCMPFSYVLRGRIQL